MPELAQIVEELSTVLDRTVAEKIGKVILSVYESAVLKRLDALESALRQLAEEMRQSQELLAQRVEEQLAAHRRETDERFRELREEQQRMYAEFQEYRKQTDQRFRELREEQQRMYAEFQEYRKQTDQRFRELAEAQRRTEERVAALAQAMLQMRQEFKAEIQEIRRQLGGLSQTVGYTLENEAMKRLPDLLQEVGIRVEGRLKRGYVRDSEGRFLEVNIFGTGYRNGEQVTLVGESKAQLSRNDVDRFLHRTVESLQGAYPNIVPLLVTHIASDPEVEQYARSLGVLVYYSYEF